MNPYRILTGGSLKNLLERFSEDKVIWCFKIHLKQIFPAPNVDARWY
jgi:lipoprotein signal peptidase